VHEDAARPVGWAPSGGDWPRHLAVDGSFVHVANQLSNSVATLRIEDDGTLTPVGEPVSVPSPTCLTPVGASSNI
jgi:6-phosphogluconolactonase (cycloisomerase 2 family)